MKIILLGILLITAPIANAMHAGVYGAHADVGRGEFNHDRGYVGNHDYYNNHEGYYYGGGVAVVSPNVYDSDGVEDAAFGYDPNDQNIGLSQP